MFVRPAVILALLLAGSGSPAVAVPPFTWPVACTHGEDCWIVRHVDRDPGSGVRDVACGAVTGDGHAGTDIALADLSRIADGVAALAPAAGRVLGTRDGMPDIATDAPGARVVEGRECGNGVRLDHGDGWISQLCHLRRGSVRVRPGDTVAAGQAVGLVGLSGETSFPHLHIGFERRGRRIDPMDGAEVAPSAGCGDGLDPLFAPAPRYVALPLVDVGVATTAPEDADILRGWHREPVLPTSAPALVVWMHGYHTAAGDEIRFRLRGPDGGTVVAHEASIERGHARGSYFAGARRPAEGWPAGNYAAEVEWRRNGTIERRAVAVELTSDGLDP